jgi:hypothetical protein
LFFGDRSTMFVPCAMTKELNKQAVSPRLRWLLWFLALALWAAFALFPISNRLTRAGGVALFAGCWGGLIALTWSRRPVRVALLALTVAAAAFLILPARSLPPADLLRADYVAGPRRYDRVTYVWGGESLKGIDCSGLIRRGLVDALFLRGVRSANPGLVRQAIALWWHDCTANDLREGWRGATVHLLDTPSLNTLDHAQVLPGDLAVTRHGIHILAYLGANEYRGGSGRRARGARCGAATRERLV